MCNGGSHHDDITHARVVKHWGNVMEQIARLTDSTHNSAIHNCVQMALSSGPFRFSIKDGHKDHHKIQSEIQRHITLHNAFSTIDPGDSYDITTKCLNVLFDVLTSHKFASLCDLLCETFQGNNAKVILDLSSVISKLANGVYRHSFELFDKDIQLVWEKFRKIGQEITLLACSSSNISQTSCQEKGMDYNTASKFTGHKTELSIKTKKNNSSYLDMISTCKQCSTETCGKSSLICDRCEAMFHITCIKPAIQNIPTGIWYCSVCENKGKPSKLISSLDTPDCQHQNCVVCRKLEDLGCLVQKENPEALSASSSSSRECLVSSLKDEELLLEPSRTAALLLCRKCGDCEDEGKKFLVCSNSGCLYKYYHIHCLNNFHLASKHQPLNCWYCPSCLCRDCLIDRDDELICMCDGCDEGYHAYCMKPPRTTVPEGKWYCNTCKLEKVRRGMRIYEESVLQKHGQNGPKSSSGANRSMDVLVPTAKKLRTEEAVIKAITKDR